MKRLQLADPTGNFSGKTAAIFTIIERAVKHSTPAFALFIAEMPHGSEEKSQPRFVLPNVAGFLPYFDHQNGIGTVIKTVENRRLRIKLVPEDKDERTNAHLLRTLCT
jgi:hypothetical protein